MVGREFFSTSDNIILIIPSPTPLKYVATFLFFRSLIASSNFHIHGLIPWPTSRQCRRASHQAARCHNKLESRRCIRASKSTENDWKSLFHWNICLSAISQGLDRCNVGHDAIYWHFLNELGHWNPSHPAREELLQGISQVAPHQPGGDVHWTFLKGWGLPIVIQRQEGPNQTIELFEHGFCWGTQVL